MGVSRVTWMVLILLNVLSLERQYNRAIPQFLFAEDVVVMRRDYLPSVCPS